MQAFPMGSIQTPVKVAVFILYIGHLSKISFTENELHIGLANVET
jgi:hypothetical protein